MTGRECSFPTRSVEETRFYEASLPEAGHLAEAENYRFNKASGRKI
jgi:hypothetical protein